MYSKMFNLNLKYKLTKLRDNIFFSDFNYYLTKGKVFPPSYVLWDCSRRCNLNCAHCGAVKEKYEKELTTDEIKKLVDQLAKMKVRFFAATGGEPLLRKDILEVMKYAKNKGIKTYIVPSSKCVLDLSTTGDNPQNLKNIKSVVSSFSSIRSTNNLVYRYRFGKKHCPRIAFPFYLVSMLVQVIILNIIKGKV